MLKRLLIPILIIVGVITGIFYNNFLQKRNSEIPIVKIGENSIVSPEENQDIPRLSVVASNLEIPWALVFLPDNNIMFTERPGRVRFISSNGNLAPSPIAVINEVKHYGEGGLMGITTHPDFENNRFVYLYFTYSQNENDTLNRVVRYKFENNSLSQDKIIVDAIPGNLFHNGGRIKFGPDKFLYITTGDSQVPSLAQNRNSLAGKILRVTDEGQPTPGNPFGSRVWSMGHRNPQGIAWDNENKLWATEHGPSTMDEINIIQEGKNYGWPVISGNQSQNGMESAIIQSGNDTWAPAGAVFLDGSLFFAGLRGQALYEYNIADKTLAPHLKGELGRIREVVVGPNNMLYITTSNRDGRGSPDNTDDKIIRV